VERRHQLAGYLSGGEQEMLAIGRNAERGTTFLLVEQNARIALGIADYGFIMENGRIVFDGPAAKLRGNSDVREFYLGLSEAGRRKSFKDIKFYKRRKRWAF
jgi:branched-chain amino acid transport system ATP-binding protein